MEAVDGTGTISTGNVDFYDVHSLNFLGTTAEWIMDTITFSKIWLTIAGLIYVVYVIYTNKPDWGREWRLFFRVTALARVPTMAATAFGIAMYFTHAEIGRLADYSTVIYEQQTLDSVVDGAYVMESVSMIILAFNACYILLFWNAYQGALVGTTFILIKACARKDRLADEDDEFYALVYTTVIMAGMTAGTFLVLIREVDIEARFNFVPSVLYKTGIIFLVVASIFLIAAVTNNWFEFSFTPVNLGADIERAVKRAEDMIESVVDDIYTVGKTLDPCTRKRSLPSDVDTGNGVVTAVSNDNQLDAQFQESRRALFEDVGDADSVCIVKTAGVYDWTGVGTRCQQLETKEKNNRNEASGTLNNPDYDVNKPYTDNDKENEYFVDRNCRNTQCNVMTGLAVSALAIASFPFTGAAGYMMNVGSRAAFQLFKIGRKIAKFAPKIWRKRKKIRKFVKVVRSLVVSTKAAFGFTVALTIMFLPVFVGMIVAFALLMFRRDVYVRKTDLKDYQIIRAEKNERGFALTMAVFLPLTVINFAFLMTLTAIPKLFEGIINLMPQTFFSGVMYQDSGFRALILAYSVSFAGSLLVLVSVVIFTIQNLVFMTGVSVAQAIRETIRDYFGSNWRRRRKIEQEGAAYDSVSFAKGQEIDLSISDQLYYGLVNRFMNFNNQALQPALFCIPVVFITFSALFVQHKEYVILSYTANHQSSQAHADISETIATRDRTEAVDQDMDTGSCGFVGKIIDAFVQALVMSKVAAALRDFGNALSIAFDAAGQFIADLASIVEFDFIKLDLSLLRWFSQFTEQFLIFALPIFCSGWIISMWATSILFEPTENGMLYASMGVFALSVANILIHYTISGIFVAISDFKFPFIKVNAEMTDAYYLTILCSLLNMASVIVTGLNYLSPIPNPEDSRGRKFKTVNDDKY